MNPSSIAIPTTSEVMLLLTEYCAWMASSVLPDLGIVTGKLRTNHLVEDQPATASNRYRVDDVEITGKHGVHHRLERFLVNALRRRMRHSPGVAAVFRYLVGESGRWGWRGRIRGRIAAAAAAAGRCSQDQRVENQFRRLVGDCGQCRHGSTILQWFVGG